MAEMKTAAYICAGLRHRRARSTPRSWRRSRRRKARCTLVREHDFLCSGDGVQTIRDDIDKEGVTHVMIAACSRRAKTEAFHFPDRRDGARQPARRRDLGRSPTGSEHDEVRQEMADDYVRMGCAELKKMKVPAGNPDQPATSAILVVGGGIAGHDRGARGGRDRLRRRRSSRKQAQLGGWAAQLWKRVPFRAPYAEPQDTGVAELVARGRARIRASSVHLNATIAEDRRRARTLHASRSRRRAAPSPTEEVGAIVQATGFSTYDIAKLPELGGGKSPNVVDQAGLEALARGRATAAPIRRADGGEVKSVVFVQCAGPARRHRARTCPTAPATAARPASSRRCTSRTPIPAVDTVVLYTDLRVPGNGRGFLPQRAGEGRDLHQGQGRRASSRRATRCKVQFRDLILDEDAAHRTPISSCSRPARCRTPGVEHRPRRTRSRRRRSRCRSSTSTYRQGKDLPQLKHGFTDSHFICFPYETRRTGIYAAGPVRRPMDIAQATEDATGAALKAIQAVENAALGPRRASALGRPVVPDRAARRLHPVQALHRRVPVRRDRRGRKALSRCSTNRAAAAAAPAWAPARCA